MSKVYFTRISLKDGYGPVASAAKKLLEHIAAAENIAFEKYIPLKTHFGERGNTMFIRSDAYTGIIDFLKEKNIATEFMETSVLYGGERFSKAKHVKLAQSHGFTQLPIAIADGENGEESALVEINKKNFKNATIAKQLADAKQVIVLSHFKGHALAGFGGALKQLSMGFASKGGKMAMHMNIKPCIINFFCKKCHACEKRCNAGAITIGKKSAIDHEKCIGCGACFAACKHHAISIITLKGLVNALFKREIFREKLAEYAFASHTGKRNIYFNFALNITRGCDCEPRPMFKYADDIGIFVSTDPVSVDAACLSELEKQGKSFKGVKILDYAEKIGVGSKSFELEEIK